MSNKCMLTTIDNPYDPFTQFDEWFNFDEEKGYSTCAYLGRICRLSDQMTEKENEEANERAIDEIIANDLFGIYIKVNPELIKRIKNKQ